MAQLLRVLDNYVCPLKCRLINTNHICAFMFHSAVRKYPWDIFCLHALHEEGSRKLSDSERETKHSPETLFHLNRMCLVLSNRTRMHIAFLCTPLLRFKVSCLLQFKLTYLFD